MAEDNHPAQPRTMTLMAGPLDTRVNPTAVNALAKSKPIGWFEKNMISTVPARHAGAGRRVYPGFVQLGAFMNMNLNRHVDAFRKLYHHLVEGEEAQAAQIKDFYEEYFAMADLPAEFYLETVRTVFQEHALPLGKLTYRERWSIRAPSAAPRSSPSRARRTTSVPSARPWPHRKCAAASGPTCACTMFRRPWGITGLQRPALGQRNLSAPAGFH
jgi:hypothetical protein